MQTDKGTLLVQKRHCFNSTKNLIGSQSKHLITNFCKVLSALSSRWGNYCRSILMSRSLQGLLMNFSHPRTFLDMSKEYLRMSITKDLTKKWKIWWISSLQATISPWNIKITKSDNHLAHPMEWDQSPLARERFPMIKQKHKSQPARKGGCLKSTEWVKKSIGS